MIFWILCFALVNLTSCLVFNHFEIVLVQSVCLCAWENYTVCTCFQKSVLLDLSGVSEKCASVIERCLMHMLSNNITKYELSIVIALMLLLSRFKYILMPCVVHCSIQLAGSASWFIARHGPGNKKHLVLFVWNMALV